MKINNEHKSQMQLVEVFVSKSSFCRKEELSDNTNMDMQIDFELKDLDLENFTMILTGKVFSEENDITASAEIFAKFKLFAGSEDVEDLKKWKHQNALAIMFPYLRAQFTLISSQSNVPLIIPTININAYFNDKNK